LISDRRAVAPLGDRPQGQRRSQVKPEGNDYPGAQATMIYENILQTIGDTPLV
jgi:hypothetical protein